MIKFHILFTMDVGQFYDAIETIINLEKVKIDYLMKINFTHLCFVNLSRWYLFN